MGPDTPPLDDAACDDAHWARLDDYFGDRLPLVERVAMDRWIAERDDRRRVVAQARTVWERAAHIPTPIGTIDLRETLSTLAARREAMDAVGSRTPRVFALGPQRQVARSRRVMMRALQVAAMVLAVVGIGLMVRSERLVPRAPAAGAMRELVTRKGQRAELELADGSHVVLGVDSKLRVAADFGRNSRDVYLDGEAYFDVKHDLARPFRVHTAHGIATDIGTRFDVRAYRGDAALVVVVAAGAVALKSLAATDSVLLAPGDLGQVRTDGRLAAIHDIDLDQYLAWREGRIVFNATPLPDALRELERWFDVEVRLADPALATRKLHGTYHDDSITEVIRDISLALDVRVERRGRIITLVSRNSAS